MIGVLAIQGNFSSHIQILNKLGYDSKLVKSSKDLDDIDGLIIPGGESTTMTKLIARENRFAKSIKSFSKEHPILGTCAGLILMSKNSFDDKVINFGIIDIESERNAYGRQVHSFDTRLDLDYNSKNTSFMASFIRAPKISKVGKNVQVICNHDDIPVAVKQGMHFATTFHPELQNEVLIHQLCFGDE
jgi:5'-phosphate synthase pdxT subunit